MAVRQNCGNCVRSASFFAFQASACINSRLPVSVISCSSLQACVASSVIFKAFSSSLVIFLQPNFTLIRSKSNGSWQTRLTLSQVLLSCLLILLNNSGLTSITASILTKADSDMNFHFYRVWQMPNFVSSEGPVICDWQIDWNCTSSHWVNWGSELSSIRKGEFNRCYYCAWTGSGSPKQTVNTR